MKKRLNYYIPIVVGFILAYFLIWKQSGKESGTKQFNGKAEYSIEQLQGVWGTSSEENALFYIDGDQLTYVEYQDTSYSVSIVHDSLRIQLDIPSQYKISQLTSDSLTLLHFGDKVEKYLVRIME